MSAGRMTLDEAGQLFFLGHAHQSPESSCLWCGEWRGAFILAVQAVDAKVLFRWAEALRSGTWKQIYGRLTGDGQNRCALGVLLDVAAEDSAERAPEFLAWLLGDPALGDPETQRPLRPLSAYGWLQHVVTELNDTLRLSFAQIADLLDEAAAS